MSLPRYPKYRNSGVEWLGDIPRHWDVWKLAHAFKDISSGTTPKSDNAAYYDEGKTPWLNTGDLNDGELAGCDKNVTALALKEHTSLKLYPENSVAIAMYGATIGKLAILRFATTVNQACCVFGESQQVSTKFLFYWLFGFRQQIVSLATGGGQPNISQDILRSLRLACPNLDEQQQIVTFLDREIAKINSLISEQENLISLLGEKREATIAHAVTKGLNPSVPMKDSGVEWLGEVPEHWPIIPFKRALILQRGHDLPSDERRDGDVPIVSSGGISGYHNVAITSGYTIVTGRYGTIGEFTYMEEGCWPLNTALYAIEMYENSPKFLWYMLQSMKSIFILNSLKAAVPGVDRNDIHPLKIALPPVYEQRNIFAFLELESARLDALTSQASQGIALLKERRSALISAAVTGKIDVRYAVRQQKIAIQEAA